MGIEKEKRAEPKTYEEWVSHYSALVFRTPPEVRDAGLRILCFIRDNANCEIKRAALHKVINTVGEPPGYFVGYGRDDAPETSTDDPDKAG